MLPGPIIAPIGPVLIARRRLLSRLEKAGATDAQTAVPLEGLSRNERRALAALRSSGIVLEPQPELYFLLPERAEEWRGAVRRRLAIGIGGALAAVAAVFAMTR